MKARRRPDGPVARGAVALTIALVLALVAPPTAAQPPPSFPDGKWWGNAFGGGEFEGEISGGSGQGEYEFAVELLGGVVTRGRLWGTAGLGTQAPEGIADLVLSLDVDLGGNASHIDFAGGTVRVQGQVVTDQITAPIDETLPAEGGPGYGFSPTSASCLQVSGDLAFEGRQIFGASGGTTTVTLPFIAYRVVGEGLAADLLRRLRELVEEMTRVLYEDAPESRTLVEVDEAGFGRVIYLDESDLRDFLQFAADVELLHDALIRTGECGLAPEGFPSGLASDDYFMTLFARALSAYLETTVDLGTPELVSLLTMAVRVGVAGASSPVPELGGEILDRLEEVLAERAEEANVAGDTATITDIVAAAEEAGLTELAELARGYL